MENLLVLLDKIQHTSPLPVFSKETIVVQNAGMQHWLNLSLAQQRGISMNIDYALPAQFLWKLLRAVASEDNIPEQSPFSREVLTWRICELLASDQVVTNEDFNPANQYWQHEQNTIDSEVNQEQQSELKRYQLACQLADLFEQYLIFRPEWIDTWHQGKTLSSEQLNGDSGEFSTTAYWQGKLWFLLTQEQAYNPVSLLKDAIANLDAKKSLLPPRISFFGINAMAPLWLSFINALSEYTQVHFFHLNPCYAYWGDIVTEKQAAKAISQWVEGYNDNSNDVGNPLLANLGQQGREFMALLHNYSTINIDVFESEETSQESEDNELSVLKHVQEDILQLKDAREKPVHCIDDSIIITSCHSALREVQGLHDWLLHQFNNDKSLTPKDILVMCPQIEDYAPYVNAVFTRGWQDIDDNIPPLPCSIADRNSKDSEPIIAAFIDLLSLPDSRFQVSQLVGLLRLPAIQSKFAINSEDLDKITQWLEQASIHWGLNKNHKAQILNEQAVSQQFTWQQGLSRLLQGFAFGDTETIYQEQLLLPTIEGDDALLLGKLMLLIEQLQVYATNLLTTRNAEQWQQFLLELTNELFDIAEESSFELIFHAIESLIEYCTHANYNQAIDLAVIKDFLNNHFSQPDPGRQFMVGQVTFCSMLPMRSIPFKIIAVLGLNDGEFPRQRQPLGFDLMTLAPTKLGDRSRRGDDRYLFLEAIISARQALYLSYQGKNIKSNTDKQASLVLKEIMEYLHLGYGWQLSERDQGDIRQLPMQAFSEQNYFGRFSSFDEKWLKLKNIQLLPNQNNNQTLTIDHVQDEVVVLNVNDMITFFQHPAKYFAQHYLDLFFDPRATVLNDVEPFTHDRLQSYFLREDLLSVYQKDASGSDHQTAQKIDLVLSSAQLRGKFPELPTTAQTFERWRHDSEGFSHVIHEQLASEPEIVEGEVIVTVNHQSVKLQVKFPIKQNQIVFYRSSQAKAKDFFNLYIHQLICQVWQQQNLVSEKDHPLLGVTHTRGLYFDTKTQKVAQYVFSGIESAAEELGKLINTFLVGQSKALLLNGDIAEKMLKTKAFTQEKFEQLWSDPNAMMPLGSDPYMEYFWPLCPQLADHEHLLNDIYQTLYKSMDKLKAIAVSKSQ